MTGASHACEPHVGSYYAASINRPTDFAPLQCAVDADVCVVGAGFTGVSTALALTEKGYRVRVLEANKIGWGASGRNGGQLIAGIAGEHRLARLFGEDATWDLRWAGHRIIRERVERYRIDCDLKRGYLDVAIKPRHVRALEEDCRRYERHGFADEFRMLSRAETRDLLGTDAYIGAMLNMGNGHLHPLNLCIGEAWAATEGGAVFHERSPVTRIEHGSRAIVHTDDGAVTADFVVLAGNAYHRLDRRLSGGVLPVNSFIMATEPLSDDIVAEINPRDFAVCDPNYILEYFRLSADKRLLFGGRCPHFGLDPVVIEQMLRPKMARIYPQLADVRCDYAWGGAIAMSLPRAPQLGRLAPNVFYAQGFAGHGVNVTHLMSEIVAEAVAGTAERFDVMAGLRFIRIPGASFLHRQIVSLGMFYYGLKDRL